MSWQWIGKRPNISGAAIAVLIALAWFGQSIERTVFPVLGAVAVDRVWWEGNRIKWEVSFCKRRNLSLDQLGYVFFYRQHPMQTGVQILVLNETLQRRAGSSPLPRGCYEFVYSTDLPTVPWRDGMQSDVQATTGFISSTIWYSSGHPFWNLSQPFVEFEVPGRPDL